MVSERVILVPIKGLAEANANKLRQPSRCNSAPFRRVTLHIMHIMETRLLTRTEYNTTHEQDVSAKILLPEQFLVPPNDKEMSRMNKSSGQFGSENGSDLRCLLRPEISTGSLFSPYARHIGEALATCS